MCTLCHGRAAYIEPLLRAHLFHQQDFRYAQLHAHVWDGFSVHKVLLQPHMAPHCLRVVGCVIEMNTVFEYNTPTFIILSDMV